MILIVSNKGYDNFTLDHQVIGVTCDAYTNYVRLTCNNRRKDQCGERIKHFFTVKLFLLCGLRQRSGVTEVSSVRSSVLNLLGVIDNENAVFSHIMTLVH